MSKAETDHRNFSLGQTFEIAPFQLFPGPTDIDAERRWFAAGEEKPLVHGEEAAVLDDAAMRASRAGGLRELLALLGRDAARLCSPRTTIRGYPRLIRRKS